MKEIYKKDINEFILTNNRDNYELSCRGNVFAEKRFNYNSEALEYFKALISGRQCFTRCYLTDKTTEFRTKLMR